MSQSVLIAGGELFLRPAGTYTKKDGSIGQSPKSISIAFGKQFMSVRADLARSLYNEMRTNEVIRNFLELED